MFHFKDYCILRQSFDFQVSLFAELFNEMLMRDFGFRIYKALVSAPEKKEEEKDKKDKDKDKKDKDSKDDRKDKDRERSNSQVMI